MSITPRKTLCLLVVVSVLVGLFALCAAVSAETTPQIIIKIKGCAYDDKNCNGCKDPDEPKLEGGCFKIYEWDSRHSEWDYKCSESGCCYEKLLWAGKYKVVYEPPPKYENKDALPGKDGTKLDKCSIEICAFFGECGHNDFLACKKECPSISGGAFRDSTCNGKLDPSDEPMWSKFKLCLPDGKGGYYCIDEQCGKTFKFCDLNENWTYFIKQCPPDGYTPSGAVAGKGGTVICDDIIRVYAQECKCYSGQKFLNCPPNTRQCFVPVTFTVDGWARFCCPVKDEVDGPRPDGGFCCPGNPLIPEGMVFTKFPIAFECFRFFGEEMSNQLVLGDDVRITYTGKTSCLENLCRLFHSKCYGCSPLKLSLDCPWKLDCDTGGECLAIETIALLMNIAYNDMRLMPKTPGVDLECYTLADGPLEGKTVGQVLFIANELLNGKPPCMFGLIDCEQMVWILKKINKNYEFQDFLTTNDRGYLIPDKPFGQPGPAHCPELKDYTKDCVVGPCVKVKKTVSPLVARIGDTVTYTYKVCNCGEEDIEVQSLTDTELGDLLPDFLAANGGSAVLVPEQCVEFTRDFVIPAVDVKCIKNTVTAVAMGTETEVEDSDSAVVGILEDNPDRQCFLPTTFTAEGWATFCDPNNGIIDGGMIYNRFPLAFKCFKFYGKCLSNELLVGSCNVYIRYIGKTSCLERLCLLLGSDCTGCGKLRYPIDCPWRLTSSEGGGCLAVETITLLLNVAYNDMRLMPRTKGVDLECYTIASGPLKGATVAQVFDIANELLQGKPPCMFGLVSCEQLVSILRQINANYEFVDFDTYIDNGFLIPNKPYDPFCKGHCPQVPMWCKSRW